MSFGGIFDLDYKQERLTEILVELESPDVWSDPTAALRLGKQKALLEGIIKTVSRFGSQLKDLDEMASLAVEENDNDMLNQVFNDIDSLDEELEKLEFTRVFCHKSDQNNAFLDIQSGSGGIDAQDWAEILMRMYLRWGEIRGFKTKIIEVSNGDIAGIRSTTIRIEGEYAYGWLRTESGIHRLVRKSPFDSGNRRHTSFASVFISPEVSDDIEITINPANLRIDTYRSSGAGGQHVNKTDSAVRITHEPTGLVVQCQSDRSQHKNKDQAIKQLKSKLYKLEMQKRNQEKKSVEESKSDIGWGSQIRSYILDQSRIKDLRTGLETTNVQQILDGDLEQFIQVSLKKGL
jgi:peptide chain release factor 2